MLGQCLPILRTYWMEGFSRLSVGASRHAKNSGAMKLCVHLISLPKHRRVNLPVVDLKERFMPMVPFDLALAFMQWPELGSTCNSICIKYIPRPIESNCLGSLILYQAIGPPIRVFISVYWESRCRPAVKTLAMWWTHCIFSLNNLNGILVLLKISAIPHVRPCSYPMVNLGWTLCEHATYVAIKKFSAVQP